MKYKKKYLLTAVLLIFSLLSFSQVYAIETQTEIKIEQSELKGDRPESNDNLYKPNDPIPVQLLPQTGEIVLSFVYIMIGLSLLIFVLGIFINKMYMNTIEVRWDY